jgi:hypothetical protein
LVAVIWIAECCTVMNFHISLHLFAILGLHGYLHELQVPF